MLRKWRMLYRVDTFTPTFIKTRTMMDCDQTLWGNKEAGHVWPTWRTAALLSACAALPCVCWTSRWFVTDPEVYSVATCFESCLAWGYSEYGISYSLQVDAGILHWTETWPNSSTSFSVFHLFYHSTLHFMNDWRDRKIIYKGFRAL